MTTAWGRKYAGTPAEPLLANSSVGDWYAILSSPEHKCYFFLLVVANLSIIRSYKLPVEPKRVFALISAKVPPMPGKSSDLW